MALNTFTAALSELCRRHLFEEKWLIAPSLRVGYQWLDAVVREGQPVLNVRVRTMRQLALDLSGPEMERRGLVFLRGLEREHLVGRALGRLRGSSGYLSSLAPSRGLIQALTRALNDLRLAGVEVAALRRGGWVEVESKGRELEALLSGYERELRRARLVDYPGVLRLAAARLRDDLFAVPGDVLVVAPREMELGALERRLWLAISATRRQSLPTDGAADAAADPQSDIELLRWVGRPGQAPPPPGDGAVVVVRAVGEVNEVRQALRSCLEQGVPLDEVEILHTDAATYVPLILEVAARLVPDDTPPPVTFGEGLPVRDFRPGRALLAWIHWVGEGFPQETLARMIQDGLLSVETAGLEGTAHRAALLRGLPVGAGRQRYLPAIDRELARLRGTDDPRLAALEGLRQLVAELVAQAPATDRRRDPLPLLRAAAHLLEHRARCAGQLDEYSRGRLLDAINEQIECIDRWGQLPGLSMREWLATLPVEARVGGQGPRPGRLYVTDLRSGGHSGRRWTFILGLDDGRFPRAGRPDPVLLDRERASLSGELPTYASRLAAELSGLRQLLARLRGQVTLSFACRSLEDDREMFPAPAVLSIHRAISGDHDEDLQKMLGRLAPPAAPAPDSPARCLDRAEWWVWRLLRQPVSDAEAVVGRHFAHLGQGLVARDARRSDRFTEYDGHVPAAGAELDPRRPDVVLSASALEQLGRCPLEFFFRHVLGLPPAPAAPPDPAVWLDAPTRGALLHDVFHHFMVEVTGQGLTPRFERDEKLLLRILDRKVAALRARQPPTGGEAFQRELAGLQQTARIFLREEEAHCSTSLPLFFEVAVGTRPTRPGTALDASEPLALSLPGGGAVRVRGTIDRVDRLLSDERRFAVWDYKTGGSGRYQDRDPFRQGRHVQGTLYVALVEARLRERFPGAGVASFGYFFPSAVEYGRRLSWPALELRRGLAVVEELCALLGAGCFPGSDRATEHSYSDYARAIGEPEQVAALVAAKLANPDNTMLAPLQRLRGYLGEAPESES